MLLFYEKDKCFLEQPGMGKISVTFGAKIDGDMIYFDNKVLQKTNSKEIFSPVFGKGEQSIFIQNQNGIVASQTVSCYEQGTATISLEIINKSEKSISADELIPLVFSAGDESFFAAGELSVYKCGGKKNKVCAFYKTENLKQFLAENILVSSMMSMLTTTQAQNALLLGFISFKNQFTEVTFEQKGSDIFCKSVCQCDGLRLGSGESITSESLILSFGDPFTQLSYYGNVVKLSCSTAALAPPPTGWCSFYTYYGSETQEKLINELEYFYSNGFKLDFFQIDDGWQICRGDWEANEKFPRGLKWFADRIHEKGYKAGIWISPFLIKPYSQLYKNNPDWVIKDSNGLPVSFGNNDDYILDMSMPETLEWLSELIRKVVYDWGYDYIKIDFLRALTTAGPHRFKYNVTRAQAYRKALEVMRAAAGENIYILGCGGHFGPDIGIVNGNRTSADTYASWKRLKANCENNLTKFWMNGALWNNDPDAVVVRGPGEGLMENPPVQKHIGEISDDEMRVALTAAYVSGGMYMPGDSLPLLPDYKVEILKKFFSTAPAAGIPRDMFSGYPPKVFDVVHPDGTHEVAIFNFEDEEMTFSYNVGFLIGNAKGRYRVTELWDKQEYGTVTACDALSTGTMPAHSCKHFVFSLVL